VAEERLSDRLASGDPTTGEPVVADLLRVTR